MVTRHTITRTASDPDLPIQVGNGGFAFGADITGLQTFLPFATMSDWGWHEDALPPGETPADYVGTAWDFHGRTVYFWTDDKAHPAMNNWLRENPHRINLGRIGPRLLRADGNDAVEADLTDRYQLLDLWSGSLQSRFTLDGSPVSVQTTCHPEQDVIAVRVESPLIGTGRLALFIDFPYATAGGKFWAFRQVPAGQFVELGGYSNDDLSQLRAYGVESPQHSLTMVLVNVQDPFSPTSTTDSVKVDLPASYEATGTSVALQSSAPGGLASTDASAITLGGRRAVFDGTPPGALDPTMVPVDDGAATVDIAPGTAQIVTFPGVELPGAVDITGMTTPGAGPLTGGQTNPVTVSVANTTDATQTVTATLQVPSGWQAGTVTQSIPALSHADLTVPVTPPLESTLATLTARVSAPQVATYGSPDLDVITAPAGAAVPPALDAGTTTSPLLSGYTRLSPANIWAEGDSFGWVGAAPSSRDRGFPDDLRRDLIASQSPATLRLNVPAGTHEAYLLVPFPGRWRHRGPAG